MAIDDDAEIGKRYPKDSDQGAKNIVDLVRALKEYRSGISGRIEQLESSVDGIDSAIQSAVSEQVATLQQELATVDSRIAAAVAAVRNQILDGVGEDFDTLMELAQAIGDNADLIGGLQDVAKSHVRYDGAQTLTDAQKTQARSNIGAASTAQLGDYLPKTGKAADAAKADVAYSVAWNSVTGKPDLFKSGDVVMNTNPFGGRRLYINSIDNALFAAHKKWFVTGTLHQCNVNGVEYPYHGDNPVDDNYWVDSPNLSSLDAGQAFDGSYESQMRVPDGYYAKIRIQFSNEEGWTPSTAKSVFTGYPYGTFYFSFYYFGYPKHIEVRTYNKFAAHGIGWHKADASPFYTETSHQQEIWQCTNNGDYQRTCIEFIIYGRPASQYVSGYMTGLSEIDWSLQRPSMANDSPTVTKYGPQKLFYTLNLGDQTTNNVSIAPSGSVTAKTFYGALSGTATRATADADGNSISSTYLKKTDASSTYLGKTAKAASAAVADSATQDGDGNVIADTYVKDKLDEKTYTNVIINNSSANGKCENYHRGFATISPDSYASQWKVRLRIEASYVYTNGNTYVQQVDSAIYGYGNSNTVAYANFNAMTSTSYRPFAYLRVYRPVDGSQLSEYPFRLCINGASHYNATNSFSRTIKVTLLEQVNCSVNLFDEMSSDDYQVFYYDGIALSKEQKKSVGYITYSSASSQSINATDLNCVDNGLQETGDVNNYERIQDAYFRPYVGTSILYAYKLCMMGDDNRLYPLVTTTSNAFNKAVQTVPLRPDSIWYYGSSTQINAGALIGGSTLYKTFPVSNCKYTFNTDIAVYQTVYLCGDFDASTGLFTLETKDKNGNASITDFYVQVPMNAALTNKATYFRTGKYYILLGGSFSTVNYMQLFIEHPMYYFDGTNLVPVIASAVRATADADGNKFSEVYAKKTDILLGPAGPTGPRGYTFTPSVSAAGVLSWTNNGGLDNPTPITIKGADGAAGAKGDKGDKGDTGSQGPAGPTGPRGYTFTPSVSAAGVLSWSNNGGLSNPASFDFASIGGVLPDNIDLGGLS